MSEHDIQKLVADHAALQKENAILKEQLALMQEQFEWLKKQVFGQSERFIIKDNQLYGHINIFPHKEAADLVHGNP